MAGPGPRHDDLAALYVNCTLKPSPELSHTQGLIDLSAGIMRRQGVRAETIRAIDHDIATGVWPDMTGHGAASDAWPQLYQKVLAADILVIAGPIWLGDNSSVTKRVIERLYGCSHLLNEAGQYAFYGRVGGCLISGNEDVCGQHLLVEPRPAVGSGTVLGHVRPHAGGDIVVDSPDLVDEDAVFRHDAGADVD
jgi:multimeric flavodoxin WrbA